MKGLTYVLLFLLSDKMMLENVKKCKNFLSTLLKLAANQPATTVKNVRDLIQGLIVSAAVVRGVWG
jgi:hypothetical protein